MSTPNTPSAASYIQNPQIDYDSIQEGQAQTLSDISELQNIELDLFAKLSSGTVSKTLTSEQKDYYTQKINEVSQMRVNLYTNLNSMYNFYNASVTTTRDTMAEQAYAIDIVENELNEAKRRLALIEEERDNKRRLVEISTYYSEKYEDHSNIMKTIIFICVPILIITFLKNRGILPANVFNVLFVIIIVIGLIVLGRHIMDARLRDNMYYDEYAWSAPNDTPAPSTTTPEDNNDPWDSCPTDSCVTDKINSMFDDSSTSSSPTSNMINQADAAAGIAPPAP